jgi:hypothetical protein
MDGVWREFQRTIAKKREKTLDVLLSVRTLYCIFVSDQQKE